MFARSPVASTRKKKKKGKMQKERQSRMPIEIEREREREMWSKFNPKNVREWLREAKKKLCIQGIPILALFIPFNPVHRKIQAWIKATERSPKRGLALHLNAEATTTTIAATVTTMSMMVMMIKNQVCFVCCKCV